MTDTIPKYRQNMQNPAPLNGMTLHFSRRNYWHPGTKNTRCIGYFISADVIRVHQFTNESQVALETVVDTLIINAFLSCAEGGKAGFGTTDTKITDGRSPET